MSKQRKVCIVGRSPDYVRMFRERQWRVVRKISEADLVQFTGGADVSPALYDEPRHKMTTPNIKRDRREILVFNAALLSDMPMAGICRGAQFLNVMCGGSLWQHIDGHLNEAGTHLAIDERTGDRFDVTSTHHQMMKIGTGGELIIKAFETTKRERMSSTGHCITVREDKRNPDPEALFYPYFKAFCFQPHPEFEPRTGLTSRYFDYLEELLLNG